MKYQYLFTVILGPHTWFELEGIDTNIKLYIICDEYDNIFLPSPAFYSWFEDNYKTQQICRARLHLKWSELRKCEKLTGEYEKSKKVNFLYANMPVFYDAEYAKQYLSQLNWNRKFDDYKVVSVYAEKSYYENIIQSKSLEGPNDLVNVIIHDNAKTKEDGELNILGYDIMNSRDFGLNIRFQNTKIRNQYLEYENKIGLLNSYAQAVRIKDEFDSESEKNSSFTMNMPRYKTKEEWVPILLAEN